MKPAAKKLSPLREALNTVQDKLNRLEAKRKHWKLRLYLTVGLPLFLAAVTVRAVQAYVRIKLQDIGMHTPSGLETSHAAKPEPEPVKTEPFQPETAALKKAEPFQPEKPAPETP